MQVSVAAAPPDERAAWIERLDELDLITPLRIVLIVIVAVVATLVTGRIIVRGLRSVLTRTGGERPRAEERHRALTSALRGALVGLIWTVAAITIISEVGVNIGAFVATATVVGGAIAFGAQTLIHDLISGFFVIAEDQYGVGDDVDIGLASGTVERITLRAVRLRDAEGRVWSVPHGNVHRVANSSQASAVFLDLHVDRASDPNTVSHVAQLLISRLSEQAQLAHRLAGPLEVIGLTDVRDDRLVVRVKAPIHANQADPIRQAWRLLVLDAFRQGELTAPASPSTVVRIESAGPERAGVP